MRHIRKYNESNTNNIFTLVDFTGGGDGVYALYIDGVLFKHGDHYHHKINDWFNGFTDGVEWAGVNITIEKYICEDKSMIEHISENGYKPPINLSDVKKSL